MRVKTCTLAAIYLTFSQIYLQEKVDVLEISANAKGVEASNSRRVQQQHASITASTDANYSCYLHEEGQLISVQTL